MQRSRAARVFCVPLERRASVRAVRFGACRIGQELAWTLGRSLHARPETEMDRCMD